MRALQVLGLADSGTNLVCEDPSTGEQFSVPCDDRLRAGARGDLSRFGQLEIEMESQLRPKDIQARIRAGASVEQIAVLAGSTTIRVERFAYPVLLERASMVTRARKARPTIDGITAEASVEDTVAATLAARGHDGEITWDAFKDDQGWVLSLTWQAGRSENHAHWLFHPGPDGGTLSARDEAAAEIVDPALRILRPLRPVRPDAIVHVPLDSAPSTERSSGSVGRPRPADSVRSTHPAGSKLPAAQARPFPLPATSPAHPPQGMPTEAAERSTADARSERMVEDIITDERTGVNLLATGEEISRTGTDSATRGRPMGGGMSVPTSKPQPTPVAAAPSTVSASATGTASVTASAPSTVPAPESAVTDVAASTAPDRNAGNISVRQQPANSKTARRGQRPAMPSWEDVLLGTRSAGR